MYRIKRFSRSTVRSYNKRLITLFHYCSIQLIIKPMIYHFQSFTLLFHGSVSPQFNILFFFFLFSIHLFTLPRLGLSLQSCPHVLVPSRACSYFPWAVTVHPHSYATHTILLSLHLHDAPKCHFTLIPPRCFSLIHSLAMLLLTHSSPYHATHSQTYCTMLQHTLSLSLPPHIHFLIPYILPSLIHSLTILVTGEGRP